MMTKTDFDMLKMVRPNILKLKPYQSAREQINDEDAILLDANENPFPSGYNRYPDPLQRKLKMALGKWKNLSPDNLFLGNGSDEIIDLLIRAFCIPGKDSVIINVPTYGMYEVCAKINDVKVIRVALDNNFQIVPEELIAAAANSKIVFICSPNNPTGNLIRKDLMLEVLEKFKGIVVVDEAYIDFADEPGGIAELEKYPNLVILQTFSKARAMAGIRIGMAFMNAEIIQILNKIKYPYNISKLNQEAALKALENNALQSGIKAMKEQKEWLVSELQKLTTVDKVYPSDANFLLVKFQNHQDVFERLRREGIIVRDRSKEPNCERCLRITIGKSIENRKLMTCLKHFEQIKI
ncbi:MAG: histidinol-phosphate transaminase [Bacteroidota bacterium]